MPRRRFIFDPPDRFVAGTIEEPGDRTFFLQAREGGRVVSVALEKVQVAVGGAPWALLDGLDLRGIAPADEPDVGLARLDTESADEAPLPMSR